jgi:hypothetical protein
MNDFYTHGGYPSPGAVGFSSTARAEFAAIMTGFDKLPALGGAAGRVVRVNPGGTALESTSSLDGVSMGQLTPAAGAFTSLSGSTLAVSGASTLSGAAALGSTLAVTGAATLSSTLAVTGATTLNSTLSVPSALATFGAGLTVSAGTFQAQGAATFNSGLSVTGGDTNVLSLTATSATVSGLLTVYNPTGVWGYFRSGTVASSYVRFDQGGTTSVVGYLGTDGGALLSGGSGTTFCVRAQNDLVLMNNGAERVRLTGSAVYINNATLHMNEGYYIYADYINSATPSSQNAAISQIITTNASDNFYRKSSLDQLANSFATLSQTAARFKGYYGVGYAGVSSSLVAYTEDSTAATMSFFRNGYYAMNMGLDTDNVFRLGGYSDGSNVYRLQVNPSGELILGNATSTDGRVVAPRGLNAGYASLTGGSENWGATIWGIGGGYIGNGAGTTYNKLALYGLAWLRATHPSATYGEGLYVYQNGTALGAITSQGVVAPASGGFRTGTHITRAELTYGTPPTNSFDAYVAHGGSRRPDAYYWYLYCLTAEHGFGVGDEATVQTISGSASCIGWANNTNVGLRYSRSGNMVILNSSSSGVSITPSYWSLRVKCIWL